MELTLEIKDQANETGVLTNEDGSAIAMMTPIVDDEYWLFRVRLSPTQAILGFPKFSTIGIGFAEEEDWNTNLPYTSGAERIFGHIIKNKGDVDIDDADVMTAIQMVIAAATVEKAGA